MFDPFTDLKLASAFPSASAINDPALSVLLPVIDETVGEVKEVRVAAVNAVVVEFVVILLFPELFDKTTVDCPATPSYKVNPPLLSFTENAQIPLFVALNAEISALPLKTPLVPFTVKAELASKTYATPL